MRKTILISLLLVIIAGVLFFIPKGNWKKIAEVKNNSAGFAAVFSTDTTGDWNQAATWGISAPGLTPLDGPGGIALSSSGNIYVVDEGNARVVVLNPDGSFSTSTSSHLSIPADIAISPSGDIYVVDVNNANVIHFDSNLNFIATSTAPFSDPVGVDVSPINGEVYVVDDLTNNITILNPNLTVSTTVSGIGLHHAQDLVVSESTGDVYVASLDKVSKFSPDFILLATSTIFSNLTGIAISPLTGDVYTVDSAYNIVVRLSSTDLTVIATSSGLGLFTPLNLDISSNGDLYVTDFNNNRVVVLNPDLSISTTYNALAFSGTEGTDYPGSTDNVTITQSITLTQDQSVDDITIASGGTLDLNGHTLNVYGNWTGEIGGTLSNSSSTASSTVNFASTSEQKILGENTFENLTKSTSNSSLLFDTDATTTVTGILDLEGRIHNPLSIGGNNIVPPIYDSIIGSTTPSAGFDDPEGMAQDSHGNIYVVEINNNEIQEFDSEGTFIKVFIASSSVLATPQTIAFDNLDNLYVVSYPSGGKLIKYDVAGHVLASSTEFTDLLSVTTNKANNQLYVTDATHGLMKLNPENLSIIFATTTSGGMNLHPNWSGMSTDFSGRYLYFADDFNNRVLKLNASDFSFVESITVSDSLNKPSSVTIDKTGNIYITDQGNNRIVKLASDASYLTSWNTGLLDFDNPISTIISDTGEIYVLDNRNKIIQKFVKNTMI